MASSPRNDRLEPREAAIDHTGALPSDIGSRLRRYAGDWRDRAADCSLPLEAAEVVESLTAALSDMREGWRYIRQHHGDLYGVGWDRAEQAADAAMAKAEGR
jgi:hypothetical protein